ncbi:keratin, type I cytoskeletal 18-A isoform X2 [Hemiscyllium ocellatum]|uniref:keratin, type I cytoskeletal 18-A isoform X2 n=1 Tax=Hemiscyllium ocellatum TaxID=170820 RepID=UPI0029669501|nr:keratin, type I cytoskeletal 18-A isoform X2 [Hemiscyllium ocellatum]
MPSITSSSSSQRRISTRAVPSFSSRSAQSSSWTRGPSSSRSSVSHLGSSLRAATASSPMLAGGTMGSSEKQTLQGLNSRLAVYLENVSFLENSNRELELKIKALLEERKPVSRDINPMLAQAHALNKQIQDLTMQNTVLVLQIDNARLSAEDFKMKAESEVSVRQTVESDIDRMRRIKVEYDDSCITLRNEGEMLTEELHFLKKNHQEELKGVKSQINNNNITVETDCVKQDDLTQHLEEMRKQYEEMMNQTKKDGELWFASQMETITNSVKQTDQEIEVAQVELHNKQKILQSLEVELEILRGQNMGLENILLDTEQRYKVDFNNMQTTISKLETDLFNVRNDIVLNKEKYDSLMQTKLTLDAELAEYRRLLKGETRKVIHVPPPRSPSPPPPPEVTTRKIVKVITTTLVDGKVVDESSEVEEISEKKHA